MLPVTVPYHVRNTADEAVRRAYKPCADYRLDRCSNPSRCRYSHEPHGKLDENCLLRSLADLKVKPEWFPAIIANALAEPHSRDRTVTHKRRQLNNVARGVRYCGDCNIDFDADFLAAYALSDGDQGVCARCTKPTLVGCIHTWIVQQDAEEVVFHDRDNVEHRARRRGTPTPNKDALHAVGPSVYDWRGERVSNRDEKGRPNEATVVRDSQLCTGSPQYNGVVDLTSCFEEMKQRQGAGLGGASVTVPSKGAVAAQCLLRPSVRVALSQAPPLSEGDKAIQQGEMARFGVRLNTGTQLPIYENWPLWVINYPKRFPRWYAGLEWVHRLMKLTVGICRHSGHWRRFPTRPDGFIPLWIFCVLPPWISLQGLAEYAGLTKVQSRVNHMVRLIITETEAAPDKSVSISWPNME